MLVKRLAEELDIDPDWVTPVQLVEQLAADTTLANTTKNTYRAAIIWACKQPNFGFLDGERRAGLEAACAFNPRKHGAVREIVRNARASARAIPEQDLRPILDALISAHPSAPAWPKKTAYWLMAGIATGARPSEWATAFWFDRDRRILRLPNIKLKKQPAFDWHYIPKELLSRADADLRAMAAVDTEDFSDVLDAARRQADPIAATTVHFDNDEARQIADAATFESLRRQRAWELRNAGLAWRDIELVPTTVSAVETHLTLLREYLAGGEERTFDKYYDGCRAALRSACEDAFDDGRIYSLYDARSTASANAQASFGPERAAEILGHYMARKRTVRNNYAGADRAFRRSGRFAPNVADTQNQRDQAADRAAEQFARAGEGSLSPSESYDFGQIAATPRF
ncbi:hypothetical protein QTI33_09540 [Variovorax sp. J22P271]|nr:hypothetical protein [Variovorax sp. J22P271]